MAEKPERTLTAKFHYGSNRDLTPDGFADLFTVVAPEIAGQIGAGCWHGRVEMDRGGYCEWRLDYKSDTPQQ